MRIHTDHHTADSIRAALDGAQTAGLIHPDVFLAVLREHRSTKRQRAFEVQLGAPGGTPSFLADDGREHIAGNLPDRSAGNVARVVKRASKRYSRNGYGTAPADSPLTATWHEWGYFLATLFAADGDVLAGPYHGSMDFMVQTTGELLSARAFELTLGDVERGRFADFLTAADPIPDVIDSAA